METHDVARAIAKNWNTNATIALDQGGPQDHSDRNATPDDTVLPLRLTPDGDVLGHFSLQEPAAALRTPPATP